MRERRNCVAEKGCWRSFPSKHSAISKRGLKSALPILTALDYCHGVSARYLHGYSGASSCLHDFLPVMASYIVLWLSPKKDLDKLGLELHKNSVETQRNA